MRCTIETVAEATFSEKSALIQSDDRRPAHVIAVRVMTM